MALVTAVVRVQSLAQELLYAEGTAKNNNNNNNITHRKFRISAGYR